MNKLKKYKFNELYKMDSGISSKPEQAGHGSPFVSFSTIFNNYFLPDKLPELMDTSIKEQHTYSVKKGDIFLTRTSETLDELAMSSVALVDYPGATFSGFAKRLRPIQENITYDKFMAFYLRSKYFRKIIDSNAIMTLRASFNEDIFSYIDVLLPEYKEQQKIGDFLYSINSKIDLNIKINAELEKIVKALYEYWFIQFDFPNIKEKPYKTYGGKMNYISEFKRAIPEGWKVNTLNQLVNNFDSERVPLSSKQREKIQGTFPYYGATGILDNINNYIFDGEYILVAEDGSVEDDKGFVLVQYISGKFWVNNHAHVIQAKNKENNEYIYWNLKMIPAIQITTGSVQKKVNQKNLNNVHIINPDSKILSKFSEIVKPIRQKISTNLEENIKLRELRDWLLPILINGQVSFK